MSVLAGILERKREEILLLRAASRRAGLEEAARERPPARDFAGALRRADGRLAVVAEVKRRSPSKGPLAPDLDPAETAEAYALGGADALSVLTDGPSFGGSLGDLEAARQATRLPELRKDFMLDPVQLLEAAAAGADAVLLIEAAITDDVLLFDLVVMASELSMAALVEVEDRAGLERVLQAGASVVGVTNRDLRSFGEDLSVSERLGVSIPEGVVAVAESAIRSRQDAERMAGAGYDAILVGEVLARAPDREAAVRSLTGIPTEGRYLRGPAGERATPCL
ncbi:MAG: indole-3-glycerol phosphate synthase TrpC [Acidimicrobiia bacterium]